LWVITKQTGLSGAFHERIITRNKTVCPGGARFHVPIRMSAQKAENLKENDSVRIRLEIRL
jgi:hypothetical protein